MTINKPINLISFLLLSLLFSWSCDRYEAEDKNPVLGPPHLEASKYDDGLENIYDHPVIPILELSNQDIHWVGSWIGSDPVFMIKNSADLRNISEKEIEHFMTWLHDPDRFVAAHVLLSMNSQQPLEYDRLFFNGLRYEIDPLENKVIYDTTQMDALYRKWSQEF